MPLLLSCRIEFEDEILVRTASDRRCCRRGKEPDGIQLDHEHFGLNDDRGEKIGEM